MKIAIIHSFYSSTTPSGENTVVRAQYEALSEAGHEVILIGQSTDRRTRRVTYNLEAAGTVTGIPFPSPRRELARFGPDIIHVHNLFPNWADTWIKQWGCKTVVTLHNYRSICAAATLWRDGAACTDCLNAGSYNAVRHRCYRDSAIATLPLAFATRGQGRHSRILHNAAHLITLNKDAADIFSRLTHTPITTVPNFVKSTRGPRAGHRQGLWLYVGRLSDEKGIDLLIRHLPRGAHLTVIGEGPSRGHVATAAREHPNRFRFLGMQDHSATLAYMAQSEALIIPSLWAEGIPTAAIEALSIGTPLVISKNCASAGDLTRYGAGVAVDLTRPEGLDWALHYVQTNWSRMSAGALRLHGSEYSQASWLGKMKNVYNLVRQGAQSTYDSDN